MLPFASHLNFLDPQTTNDGQPYGPIRYRELVKECYLLSKNLHTSYTDILQISPIERNYLFKFLIEDAEREKEAIEKKKAEIEANRK